MKKEFDMCFIPVKQTAQQELAWLNMQQRVEQIKQQMGSKYLLDKSNQVQRKQ